MVGALSEIFNVIMADLKKWRYNFYFFSHFKKNNVFILVSSINQHLAIHFIWGVGFLNVYIFRGFQSYQELHTVICSTIVIKLFTVKQASNCFVINEWYDIWWVKVLRWDWKWITLRRFLTNIHILFGFHKHFLKFAYMWNLMVLRLIWADLHYYSPS